MYNVGPVFLNQSNIGKDTEMNKLPFKFLATAGLATAAAFLNSAEPAKAVSAGQCIACVNLGGAAACVGSTTGWNFCTTPTPDSCQLSGLCS
jgi:hypothetical protein